MNTLYYGDNLGLMGKLIRDETVDLCYPDEIGIQFAGAGYNQEDSL